MTRVARPRPRRRARRAALVREPEVVEIDAEDEPAIGVALTEIRAGQYTTGAELRAFLRRP